MSGKWRPFCLGLNVLSYGIWHKSTFGTKSADFLWKKVILIFGDSKVIVDWSRFMVFMAFRLNFHAWLIPLVNRDMAMADIASS